MDIYDERTFRQRLFGTTLEKRLGSFIARLIVRCLGPPLTPENIEQIVGGRVPSMTDRELRLRFDVFCCICIAFAVMILFSDHPSLAAFPIGLLCLISFSVYKRWKASKTQ